MPDTPTVPMPDDPPKSRRKTTGTTGPTDSRGKGGNSRPDDPAPRRATESTPRPRRPSARSLEGRLQEFLGTAALPFALTGDDYCATIIAQRTPALATSLVALADENPAIKRVLNRMLEGSAWGGVALAVASIAIPIAQHHRMIPGNDPFSFMYPGTPQRTPSGIPSPPAGFNGWSQPAPADTSTMGAPAPAQPAPEGGAPTTGNANGEIPRYLDGAPPGVVTVAATSAQHPGAR